MNIKEYTKYYKVGIYNFTTDSSKETEFLDLEDTLSYMINKVNEILYLFIVRDKITFILNLVRPCDKDTLVMYLINRTIFRMLKCIE